MYADILREGWLCVRWMYFLSLPLSSFSFFLPRTWAALWPTRRTVAHDRAKCPTGGRTCRVDRDRARCPAAGRAPRRRRSALALAGRWYEIMSCRAGRNALAFAGRWHEAMPYRAGRNAMALAGSLAGRWCLVIAPLQGAIKGTDAKIGRSMLGLGFFQEYLRNNLWPLYFALY